MKKVIVTLLALFMMSAPLAACGKKAPPKPPSEGSKYPSNYPKGS